MKGCVIDPKSLTPEQNIGWLLIVKKYLAFYNYSLWLR